MNKDKATAVIYKDWSPMILGLEAAQAGELIQAVYRYWGGENVTLSPSLRPIFSFIIEQIEKNEKSYEEAKQKRIEGRRRQLENSSSHLKSLEVTSSQSKSLKPTVNVNVNGNVNGLSKDNYKEILSKESTKKAAPRFLPPSVEEVRAYCQERKNTVDPEGFVNFYSSKGWKIGSQSMKDWKAAVRTWEKRENFTSPKRGAKTGADAGITYLGNTTENTTTGKHEDIFDLFG